MCGPVLTRRVLGHAVLTGRVTRGGLHASGPAVCCDARQPWMVAGLRACLGWLVMVVAVPVLAGYLWHRRSPRAGWPGIGQVLDHEHVFDFATRRVGGLIGCWWPRKQLVIDRCLAHARNASDAQRGEAIHWCAPLRIKIVDGVVVGCR